MDKAQFVKRVLTDPAFRRTLETSPEKILGPNPTRQDLDSVKKVLAAVGRVDARIDDLADTILCLTPPPPPPD